MKISNIEVYELEIPFDRGSVNKPAPDFLKTDGLDFCLIKVESEDGCVGWGDAFAYNCRQSVAQAVLHMVKPRIIGREINDICTINLDLQRDLHMFGRYGITMFAISGVDIALWDLFGKRIGLPLCEIFGSVGDKLIPAYASLWRYQDLELVSERVKAAKLAGYEAIKLHEVGLKEVQVARDQLGQDVPLMLDTNCPWSPQKAREMVSALEDFNLYWLEEPINPPEDFKALSNLRRDTGVRIASGEHACTSFQFREIFEKNAVDFAQPSVTKVGGISEFRKIVVLCDLAGAQIMPHSPYFGPGFLATLQLSQTFSHPLFLERFFIEPEASLYPKGVLDPVDGRFSVPRGPGLGVDPDLNVIKTYLKKHH